MEQDFKLLSEVFNVRYESFFDISANKNIEYSLYALGILLRSRHHKYAKIRPYNPKDHELINEWDIDIWTKVTWGADDNERDIEEHTILMDKALANTPYYDHLVSNAVKYNRPTWSLFGLIGMMQGSLNQNAFEVQQYEIFTREDFVRNLKYLPIKFLKDHKENLMYLFSYFDERGFSLIIDDLNNISIIKKES